MNVYFIRTIEGPPRLKIGKATKPEKRLAGIQVTSPFKLALIGVIQCNSEQAAWKTERELHLEFAEHRVHGEWFLLTREVEKRVTTILAFEVGGRRLLYRGSEVTCS